LAVDGSQAKNFSWLSKAAKGKSLLGSRRQPTKRVYLAVDGSQANKFPWRMYPFLGALKVLSASYLPWQPNSQGNNSWQSAAKDIVFTWLSRLGGLCLAVGRQEQLPWR